MTTGLPQLGENLATTLNNRMNELSDGISTLTGGFAQFRDETRQNQQQWAQQMTQQWNEFTGKVYLKSETLTAEQIQQRINQLSTEMDAKMTEATRNVMRCGDDPANCFTGRQAIISRGPHVARGNGLLHMTSKQNDQGLLAFSLEADDNFLRFATFRPDGQWAGRHPFGIVRNVNNGTVDTIHMNGNVNVNTGPPEFAHGSGNHQVNITGAAVNLNGRTNVNGPMQVTPRDGIEFGSGFRMNVQTIDGHPRLVVSRNGTVLATISDHSSGDVLRVLPTPEPNNVVYVGTNGVVGHRRSGAHDVFARTTF